MLRHFLIAFALLAVSTAYRQHESFGITKKANKLSPAEREETGTNAEPKLINIGNSATVSPPKLSSGEVGPDHLHGSHNSSHIDGNLGSLHGHDHKPVHDASDFGEKQESLHGHDESAHHALLAMVIFLVLGTITQAITDRMLPSLPYTCIVFLWGAVISVADDHGYMLWGDLSKGIDMWQSIDPHFALYAFLPALLFADAMNINVAMLRNCFWQCFILAVPGVLIGTALTGVAMYYLQPALWDWGWSKCFLFGSILSATDPVAVVAIFNSLGVSPRLTMLIGGESLFNDGTAVVLFEILLQLSEGTTFTKADVLSFTLNKILLGPLLGVVVGWAAVRLIKWTSTGTFHTDSTVQALGTMCCAYAGFLFAEAELGSSGVLAAVVAGTMFAGLAKQSLVSRESIHTVWHSIEFIGNTLIFMMAGIVFAHSYFKHKKWERDAGVANTESWYHDWTMLLITYMAALLIRACMVAVLLIPLNLAGQRISLAEAFIMSWAGLRGAVGLLMAVIVSNSSVGEASLFPFLIGGVAAMTLFINGILTPKMLKLTGFMRMDEQQEKMLKEVDQRVSSHGVRSIEDSLADKDLQSLFQGIDKSKIMASLTFLNHEDTTKPAADEDVRAVDQKTLEMLRNVLLRCVRQQYYDLADKNIIPRKDSVLQTLISRTDSALMNCEVPLSDWEQIKAGLLLGRYAGESDYRANLAMRIWDGTIFWKYEELIAYQISGCIAFIQAHNVAATQMARFHGDNEEADSPEEIAVTRESSAQAQVAEIFLNTMPADRVQQVRMAMLAKRTQKAQEDLVENLIRTGVLTGTDGEHMIEHLHHQYEGLDFKSLS